MKLLFVTMEGCPACIVKREMVYDLIPSVFPGIEIEEIDIDDWDRVCALAGQMIVCENKTPAFIMLADNGTPMFQITGVPGTGYLARLVSQYNLIEGFSVDEPEESNHHPILSLSCVSGECMR